MLQERLARERRLKEIAEAHAQGNLPAPVSAESVAAAEAAERKRRRGRPRPPAHLPCLMPHGTDALAWDSAGLETVHVLHFPLVCLA